MDTKSLVETRPISDVQLPQSKIWLIPPNPAYTSIPAYLNELSDSLVWFLVLLVKGKGETSPILYKINLQISALIIPLMLVLICEDVQEKECPYKNIGHITTPYWVPCTINPLKFWIYYITNNKENQFFILARSTVKLGYININIRLKIIWTTVQFSICNQSHRNARNNLHLISTNNIWSCVTSSFNLSCQNTT